jgi:hypothetical protein
MEIASLNMSHQTPGSQKNWLYFAFGAGSMLVIGAIVLATSSSLGKSTQVAGTWKVEANGAPAGTPEITVVINNEGKIIALNPTNSAEAIEVGKIIKVSDVVDLPKGANLQANPFANQASKARQSEAKTYVGSMNKSQQAHFLEKSRWGKTIDELGIGIKSESENYRYTTKIVDSIKTVNIKNYPGIAVNTAIAKKDGLKSYVGFAYLVNSGSDINTFSVRCESQQPTTKESDLPKFDGKEIKCPDDYIPL